MSEVIGVVDLPSVLSITWIVLVLPTTCKSPSSCIGRSRLTLQSLNLSLSRLLLGMVETTLVHNFSLALCTLAQLFLCGL